MPTTPIGTRTLVKLNPLANVEPPITSPIGSLSWATCRKPSAIDSMRAGVKRRRSCMDSRIPLVCALSISFSLASRISSQWLKSAAAMASRALFFCPLRSVPILTATSWAAWAFWRTNTSVVLIDRSPNSKWPNHLDESLHQKLCVPLNFQFLHFGSQ